VQETEDSEVQNLDLGFEDLKFEDFLLRNQFSINHASNILYSLFQSFRLFRLEEVTSGRLFFNQTTGSTFPQVYLPSGRLFAGPLPIGEG
jgi:hypothetical protein